MKRKKIRRFCVVLQYNNMTVTFCVCDRIRYRLVNIAVVFYAKSFLVIILLPTQSNLQLLLTIVLLLLLLLLRKKKKKRYSII
jgi:LPXTG-motif cell wall-anchored protein